MPREMAKFLNKPNWKQYTGHAFRRTSTTLLADSGAIMSDIKRHGGWKSSRVAQEYICDSTNNKRKIHDKIFVSSTSHDADSNEDDEPRQKYSKSDRNQNNFNFSFNFAGVAQSNLNVENVSSNS